MATTTIPQTRAMGAEANLPDEIVEGQLLYSYEGNEYIDHDGVRTRLNPPGDWLEPDTTSPNYIANKPDFVSMLNEIDIGRREVGGVNLYGVLWDKTSSSMQRLYDSASITTDTTNFVHKGTINPSYDNPFDSIYPWSDCKQCNVDLDTYRALSSGDDIRDAVTAWYGDPDFATDGSNGFVGRYTPEFWYYGYENEEGKFVLVADKEIPGFIHHKPCIRSHGFAVDDGNDGVTSNDGQPMTNVAVSSIHTKATAGGFTLLDVYEYDADVALFMVEFASTDAQSKLGDGCSSGSLESNTVLTNNYDNATELLFPAELLPYAVPGATLDFGSTKGAVVLADRRTIVSSESYNSTYCKITFTPSISQTAYLYPSIHGVGNGDSLGNRSGYLGINGKNNAWYRGVILYGNRFQYILGAARQAGTGHLWLCPSPECDSYDGLNTSAFTDTGIVILSPNSNSWQNIGDYSVPEGKLAAWGPIKTATSRTGDAQYCVTLDVSTMVAFVGGSTGNGNGCGVLCVGWNQSYSVSGWNRSACLLLRSP